MHKTYTKAKRGKRGLGRLYKRDKNGLEHKANSKAQGFFYLEYRINGKRIRELLTNSDGQRITNLRDAKAEQARIMAPYMAASSVENPKAVQSKINDAESELNALLDQANPPTSIEEAWEAYLASSERPDSGESTLKYYNAYWRRFKAWLDEFTEVKYLRDVTSKHAQDYASQLGKGFTPNTYNKHIGFLKLLFRVLEEPARISDNPLARIRKKTLETNPRRELTIAELKTILEQAEGDLQTLLYLGTFTGLRLGDCCTLRWNEVDLDRGLIRRVPNKTARKKRGPIVVGIPEALHEELAIQTSKPRQGYVVPRYAELYTYRNQSGRHTRQPDIAKEIQKHFHKCGIQTHKEGTGVKNSAGRAVIEVGFHSLRHTYVSLHAERGTPQAVVQAIVGHGNPAMTAHYTHIGEETARQTADSFTLLESPQKNRQTHKWIEEKLRSMTEKNWKAVRSELLKEAL